MNIFEDKLDRKDFVCFIEELIMNSEQYKRSYENNSYVIALDSPWGTGKSYFLKLLNQELDKKENIIAVNYNAWENDYCNDAFNPLIYDILNCDKISFIAKSNADRENIKRLLLSIMKVGVAIGKRIIADSFENKTYIDLEKAIDEMFCAKKDIKDFIMREVPNLRQLNEQRKSFNEFKKYLSATTNWMKDENIKLVIIIDELDRCKPTFAIQTLEFVKHIFDIENIVFLFAIDAKQLSHSISSVYGDNFDSVGYLSRFFDYIAKMPIPNINSYIFEKLTEKFFMYKVSHRRVDTLTKDFLKKMADFISKIYRVFEFSLRDLDTFIQTYKIMLNRFLNNYTIIGAHEIFLFYLAIKYKYPRMFERVFLSSCISNISDDLEPFVRKNFPDNPWLISSVESLKSTLQLQQLPMAFCDECGNASGDLYKLNHLKEDGIYCIKNINEGKWASVHPFYKISEFKTKSMGNIIFYPDIRRWKTIKHRTYCEHLHKQLEMFNFLTGIDASYETDI